MAKKKLGKGLSVLVADTIDEAGETDATMIALSAIVPHKGQPRTKFDKRELEELTESIKQHGVLQPLLVRPKGSGYEIVAGERRFQASKKAGLKQVPALIQHISDEEILSLALIENLQRSDLNPLEEARGYKKLMETQGLTQAQVATTVSKSRPAVANALRLIELPQEVQKLLEDGVLTSGHARPLLALTDKKDQAKVAKSIVNQKLSVRQTEQFIKEMLNPTPKSRTTTVAPKNNSKTTDAKVAESALSDILGTKVVVRQTSGKQEGTITIHFKSNRELKALIRKMG